jgi:hypothetical protein
VEETLDGMAQEGVRAVILQPIGFLCDHVEILFDVDRLFKDYAAKLGIRLERPESLNASRTLARAVADLAQEGLARLAGKRWQGFFRPLKRAWGAVWGVQIPRACAWGYRLSPATRAKRRLRDGSDLRGESKTIEYEGCVGVTRRGDGGKRLRRIFCCDFLFQPAE